MKGDIIYKANQIYLDKRGGVQSDCKEESLSAITLNEIVKTMETVDKETCTDAKCILPMSRVDVTCDPVKITNTPNLFSVIMDTATWRYDSFIGFFTFTARLKFSYLNPLTPNHISLASNSTIAYDMTTTPTAILTNAWIQTFVREGYTDYWNFIKVLVPVTPAAYNTIPVSINYALSFSDSSNLTTLTGQIPYTP